MDPTDLTDFVLECDRASGGFLETGEQIATLIAEVDADANALGFGVSNASGYAPAVLDGGTSFRFFCMVDPAKRDDPAFAGTGKDCAVTFTMTTDSQPERRYQRTAAIKVRQR